MAKTVSIAGKKIGKGHPCFVIAEAGSNHNGRLNQALALINVAADAGADAVKFQIFKADKLYLKTAGRSRYLKSRQSIYNIIKSMEIPISWLPKLARHCQKRNLLFLSSPFDEESVDDLGPYVPAFKIASYEMTATPLVEYIAKKKKPILMSTGTANLKEVKEAIGLIRKKGNHNIVLMQCTACYPAPLSAMNLKSIWTMQHKFSVPVGLSDHSREWDVAPIAAVAMGADCLEKHFTLSNRMAGPDHRFALEPHELKMMIQKIRDTEKVLGSGIKEALKEEKELLRFARRSIFIIKSIKKGEKLTRSNIAVLRCGNQKGYLKPAEYKKVLNRSASSNLRPNRALQLSHCQSHG